MEDNILEILEGREPEIRKDVQEDDSTEQKFDFIKWFNKKKNEIRNLQFVSMYDVNLDIMLKLSGGKLHLADNFSKVFSPFLLCRYISMNKRYIEHACTLNTISSSGVLSPEEFYKLAYRIMPESDEKFVAKYIKKDKDKKMKKDFEEISQKELEVKNCIFDL